MGIRSTLSLGLSIGITCVIMYWQGLCHYLCGADAGAAPDSLLIDFCYTCTHMCVAFGYIFGGAGAYIMSADEALEEAGRYVRAARGSPLCAPRPSVPAAANDWAGAMA